MIQSTPKIAVIEPITGLELMTRADQICFLWFGQLPRRRGEIQFEISEDKINYWNSRIEKNSRSVKWTTEKIALAKAKVLKYYPQMLESLRKQEWPNMTNGYHAIKWEALTGARPGNTTSLIRLRSFARISPSPSEGTVLLGDADRRSRVEFTLNSSFQVVGFYSTIFPLRKTIYQPRIPLVITSARYTDIRIPSFPEEGNSWFYFDFNGDEKKVKVELSYINSLEKRWICPFYRLTIKEKDPNSKGNKEISKTFHYPACE